MPSVGRRCSAEPTADGRPVGIVPAADVQSAEARRTGGRTAAGSCWRSGGWIRTVPPIGSYRRTSDFRVSPTDPDATPMRTGDGTALGYHDHYVVDGGKRAHHPRGARDPGRRHGERAAAGPALAGLLPAQAAAAPGDRRHHLRHGREHRRARGRRHPGVLPAARFRPAHAVLRQGRVHLRRRARCVPLPAGAAAAAPQDQVHRGRGASTGPTPRPATRVPSKRSARPATTAASCTGPSTRTTSTRCAATTPPRPTRRRCANGRSGSSRSLPKRRSGMAYAGSACAACMNANIQGLLIAAGQNLKRFLAATGWGRRHAPCGSLVALPREPRRLAGDLVSPAPSCGEADRFASAQRIPAAAPAARDFFNRQAHYRPHQTPRQISNGESST